MKLSRLALVKISALMAWRDVGAAHSVSISKPVGSYCAFGTGQANVRREVPMPSLARALCPPPLLDDQWTIMDRPSAAHRQANTLSPRSTSHRGQAPAGAIAEDGAPLRALLHQSAVSWTRRNRVVTQ